MNKSIIMLIVSTLLLLLGTNAVAALDNATFVSQDVPTTMMQDQYYEINMTFNNTGTSTWNETDFFRLGSQDAQDNTQWGTNRNFITNGTQVHPGEEYTFVFNATPVSTGVHTFRWQMVHDLIGWFGEKSDAVEVTVKRPNDAKFVSQFVPSTMKVNVSNIVLIKMNNTGTNTWNETDLYKLGSQSPQDNTQWGSSRQYIASETEVAPGETYTFSFLATPAQTGNFTFQWQMLEENEEWFGDKSSGVTVEVTN